MRAARRRWSYIKQFVGHERPYSHLRLFVDLWSPTSPGGPVWTLREQPVSLRPRPRAEAGRGTVSPVG